MHPGLVSPATWRAASTAEAARREGRKALLETEALDLASGLGLTVPERLFVRDAAEAAEADLSRVEGERVVVKAVSPGIAHKTEAGAVAVVEGDRAEIVTALGAMARRLSVHGVRGFTLNRFVPHERSLGHELLLGMRWTDDFGPVVTLGAGGIHAEHLARSARPGAAVAVLSPLRADREAIEAAVEPTLVGPLLMDGVRGQPPLLGREAVVALLERWLDFASRHLPADLLEFEVNPAVLAGGALWALDARGTVGSGTVPEPMPPRPIEKIERLLRPKTLAIAGVSERRNPGRVILENVLAEGFDPAAIRVIKPGTERLAGVGCVPCVSDLPEPADLLVLSVDAESSVRAIEEVVESGRAESVILIPGGIGERTGTEDLAARLRRALDESRSMPGKGPVVNGGNCLGIRSLPGGYDTLFIPSGKLGRAPRGSREAESPLALVSQSGAFACARSTTLAGIEPRWILSIGNQIDLTAGDYMEWLAVDPGTEIVACYLEGFRPGDGARWLEAAERMIAHGRDVLLYRAGRSEAGAGAAASHTASVAGDWTVLRALASQAGVVVAETLDEFDDLSRLFTRLRGKAVGGLRVGALSNAGFESVAFADALGPLRLAKFTDETRGRLHTILASSRLEGIVAPTNPVDTTPILGDEGFAEAARAVLDDPGVDLAVIGCVPMTPALATLPASEGQGEDVHTAESVASRLVALAGETETPWVAVVDGGAAYEPFRQCLERAGIPTFRSADRAVRLLGVWAERHRSE